MAKYKSIVITDSGLALVAATHSGGTIQFTAMKTGNGVYEGTEVLESMTDLKSVRQTFAISGVTREAAVVRVRSVLSNEGVTEGYYLTEIGLYALDQSTGTELLYAIIIAENDKADYFTTFEEFPQSMTLETYITVTGVEEGVTFTASILDGAYVAVQDFEEHIADTELHITSEERAKWNAKVDSTGTVANALNADTLDGYHASSFLRAAGENVITGNLVLGNVSGDEGGELILSRPETNTVLDNALVIDIMRNFFRIYGTVGGSVTGVQVDFETLTGLKTLLHTGNSVPVIISNTTPTDTTALWIQ